MPELRIPCVGAILTAGERILLIRRGHEPEAGRWSLPGGRIEPGETDQQALVREVREEIPGPLAGAVERPAPGGRVLEIRDYAATVAGGVLAAGDDADDARWFSVPELAVLPLTTGLIKALYEWGVLGVVPTAAVVAEATRRAGLVWLTVPGLAGAGWVAVTVPSKESRGTLVTWTAAVGRVDPGSAEWDEVIGPLRAARLNADLSAAAVYRLSPRVAPPG